MCNSHVHPIFAGMLDSFSRTFVKAAVPAVPVAAPGVVHLNVAERYTARLPHWKGAKFPACNLISDAPADAYTTDPREVSCRACQLALPEVLA